LPACTFTLLRRATFSLPTQDKGRKKLVCSPFRRTLKIPTPVAIAPLGIFILQGKTERGKQKPQGGAAARISTARYFWQTI